MDLLTAEPVPAEQTALLDWLADPRPDRGLHVAGPGESWSYTAYPELALAVRSFGASLQDSGAEPRSVAALLVTDPRSFVVSFMAALAAGLVPSPVVPLSSFRSRSRYAGHLARHFAAAKPAVVVAGSEALPDAAAALAECGLGATLVVAPGDDPAAAGGRLLAEPVSRAGDALALLQFTSGSSGDPKGVRVSSRSLTANVTAIRDWLGLRRDDVYAGWLPLFHDMGLIGGMITPVAEQVGLRLMTPEQFIRAPQRWLDCFGRGDATITTAPSFGYAYASRRVRAEDLAGSDFSGWRAALLGAERIDATAIAGFTALVRPHGFDHTALVSAYGLAECTLAVTGSRPGTGGTVVETAVSNPAVGEPVGVRGGGVLGLDRVGGNALVGCGTPVGDTRVSIVDDEGQPLPDGVFGEITVSGSSLADGYLHADGSTTAFDQAGHRTGDAGFRWQDQLYVVGRVADSLKVRGAMLFAEDLEAELGTLDGLHPGRLVVLLGHADGSDHAVVLVEDDDHATWLEPLVTTLRAHTDAGIACSVLTGQRGAIERTSSGKPRRRVLWRALLDGGGPGWTPVHGPLPALPDLDGEPR